MRMSAAVAGPVPAYRDWRDDAACRDADPELFFPDGDVRSARAQVTMAKLTCRRCPVSATCLSWALASGQEAGIWGGLTEAERHRLLRRTRPGRYVPRGVNTFCGLGLMAFGLVLAGQTTSSR